MNQGEKIFFVVEKVERGKNRLSIIERAILRKQGNFFLLDGRAGQQTNHISVHDCRDTKDDAILLFLRRKYNQLTEIKKEYDTLLSMYNDFKEWAKKQ